MEERPHAADPLETLNRRLARLIKSPAADLSLGAGRALGDELVFSGILGGKDVGKSTLINSLAGESISSDEEEVGEGTSRPMAYIHEDARAQLLTRFDELSRVARFDVVTHTAAAVRNVVLLDLPDFDSEFRAHLETVRAVAPLLDRVLWVVTPRKVGDRAWVELVRKVIKDPRNVHCVLNKLDELLTDADAFDPRCDDPAQAFMDAQRSWVLGALTRAGLSADVDDHFLIAAKYPSAREFGERIEWLWDDASWQRFSADRATVARVAQLAADEFQRLRRCILSTVSADQAIRMKHANRRRERHEGATLLRRHYDVDRLLTLLEDVSRPSYRDELCREAFEPAYVSAVYAQLAARMRSDSKLSEDLLVRRLSNWPLIGAVYGLFGWLPRWLGHRLAPSSERSTPATGDLFEPGGAGLAERCAALEARIASDHAALLARMRTEEEASAGSPDLADRLRRLASDLPRQLADDLVEAVHAGDAPPAHWKKALIWLVALWFPLAQPVLEGVLHTASATGATGWTLGLYQVVAALGAVRILSGLLVVAVCYVVLLTVMYARALRDVRLARLDPNRTEEHVEMLRELLRAEAVDPLVDPVANRLAALVDAMNELKRLESVPDAA